MIYMYNIREYNGKEALYLYLTVNEELSNELGDNNTEDIENRCRKYIKDKNIEFDGDDVFLVVNGIVVKNVNIKNKDINIEVLDNKCDYVDAKFRVNIKDSINNSEKTLALKDFLIGVLFTNSTSEVESEVLKAMCVLYRTYAFYRMEKDNYIDIDDSFMKYRSISYYKLLYIDNYEDFYKKILDAVTSTDCVFITYNNQYIKPYIHHTNNGFTEESPDIPYLEKKYSLWDLLSPLYLNIKVFNYEQLEKFLNVSKDELQYFKILELTSSGKIKKVKIGPIVYTGDELKERLKLNSTDLTILINDYNIKFITRGYGHGLGLSISGASELARSKCSYLQILNYYFSKCKIKKYI